MLDRLKAAIREAKGAQFIEVRAVDAWTNSISVKDGKVHSIRSGNDFGFGVRVLERKCWGFAASNDPNHLRMAVRLARKYAHAAARKPINAKLAPNEVVVDHVKVKVKKRPESIALEDKAARCIELCNHGKGKDIVTTDVRYMDGKAVSYYTNSEGAEIIYEPVRSVFAFNAVAKGERLFSADDKDARLVGVEILDNKEDFVADVSKKARLMTKSKLPPAGRMPVVIDPKMAGVLAHEAIGHACEADTVLTRRSILADKLNKKIGSELVTIVDDPTIPGMYGSYPYDAEGTRARRKFLVRKGRLKTFMQTRETAGKSHRAVTGNARAESVSAFPLVRMSNTFFEAGTHSLDELLEGIKRGVYVSGMKGGVSEPNTGFFQFAAEHGYLIENGEKTVPLRDITLVGNMLDTLQKVDGAGKEVRMGTPGTCGKSGQGVPVSDGGPHLRIKDILVGG